MDNAFALMWGAEDLFAVLGGTANRYPDGSYRDVARHVRSQTLLAAKAYGRMALDSVYLDIKDLDGLRQGGRRRGRRRLRRQGRDPPVAGRGHPRRLRTHAPTRSTGRDTCWRAARDERGVFQYEGMMVDAPVLRRAERIVALAPKDGG